MSFISKQEYPADLNSAGQDLGPQVQVSALTKLIKWSLDKVKAFGLCARMTSGFTFSPVIRSDSGLKAECKRFLLVLAKEVARRCGGEETFRYFDSNLRTSSFTRAYGLTMAIKAEIPARSLAVLTRLVRKYNFLLHKENIHAKFSIIENEVKFMFERDGYRSELPPYDRMNLLMKTMYLVLGHSDKILTALTSLTFYGMVSTAELPTPTEDPHEELPDGP